VKIKRICRQLIAGSEGEEEKEEKARKVMKTRLKDEDAIRIEWFFHKLLHSEKRR